MFDDYLTEEEKIEIIKNTINYKIIERDISLCNAFRNFYNDWKIFKKFSVIMNNYFENKILKLEKELEEYVIGFNLNC